MEWITLPPRGHRFDSTINILHTTIVLLLVATSLGFVAMGAFIHNFSTLHPDTAHPFPINEHGGTFFLNPMLGRLYVNMPWIWLTTLGGSILVTRLRAKSKLRPE